MTIPPLRSKTFEPRFEVYEGDDPMGLVIALNVERGHLTESQKGA